MNLEPELNFVMEFNLSRNGMIREIKTEMDIIRLCFTNIQELDSEYVRIVDRIIVMPIRKLLCENNSSVLLKVCPDFRMPPLAGIQIQLDDKMNMYRPPLYFVDETKWIPVSDWLEQVVAYFDRNVEELPDIIPTYVFQSIVNRLKGNDKDEFKKYFINKSVLYQGENCNVYVRKNPEDNIKNEKIYDFLEKVGYNKLNLYNFLKHQSDKRGAHIDVGHSVVVEMVDSSSNGITLIHCIALQLIVAVKKQIPELSDYWDEIPDIRTMEQN